MTEYAIEIKNLTKIYGRETKALDNLSFSIPKGSICGVVGANGAGKTTLYSIIAGYLPFDSGSISVLGEGEFNIEIHKGRVTILPQDAELIPEMSIRQLLIYYARLQGIYGLKTDREVARVLKNVDLLDRWDTKISQLSHGMRRRVSVAQTLLGSPELILLDEPSAGLDPIQTSRLRRIFKNKPEKSTLVISSHILSELEEVCDYIVFMDKGKCTQQGDLTEITGQTSTVRIRFEGDLDILDLQQKLPQIQFSTEKGILICKQKNQNDVSEINGLVLPHLLQSGHRIYDIQVGYRLAEHYESRGRIT
jgi:ABC-2 type transport system ATP-binding protein